MKVFLDDERTTPDGWWRTYTPDQTIAMLESDMVTHLSLDHDLGEDNLTGTGYDVILWIEEMVVMGGFKPPRIFIHTANPSARLKMEAGRKQIETIYRAMKEADETKTDMS
jgi:hypothetical protein